MVSVIDDYYDSIQLHTVIVEGECGAGVVAIRDMTGRWHRDLCVGYVPDRDNRPMSPLPRAKARYRQ